MKRYFILLSLTLICAIFNSCEEPYPKCAEEQEVLLYVYDKTYEERESIAYEIELFTSLFGTKQKTTEEKIQQIQLLEWCYERGNRGKNYIGYLITYQICFQKDETRYALLQLTEFDNGKYEGQYIGSASSISELNDYLY